MNDRGHELRQPRAQTLEEVIEQQEIMKKEMHDMKTSVERIETALVGEWTNDGTYRDGWIQVSQRDQRFFRWIGVLLTSVLTGLLVFAAENWWTLHTVTAGK